MTEIKTGWQNYTDKVKVGWEEDVPSTILTGFFHEAAFTDRRLYHFSFEKLNFKSPEDPNVDKSTYIENMRNSFIEEIEELGIKEFYRKNTSESKDIQLVHISNDSSMCLSICLRKHELSADADFVSFDEEYIDKIKLITKKYLTKLSSDNLFVITESDDGLQLTSIGKPGISLERHNYSEHVVNSFDYIKKQFSSTDPFGRLAILHGSPGTGKTHMLRAMIKELTGKNKFLFIQPDYLIKHSMSAIIKLLINATNDGSSLIILIEDADDILVPRQSDNMSAISNLLNFADGFIGNLLNLKIIATTNASKFEIDGALKRPGRLCKVVDVGSLSISQSNKIFERITNTNGTFTKKMTLAEIYSEAYIKLGMAESSDTVFTTSVGFGR